jgi:hypothetical protein
LKERELLRDINIDWSVILKWILKEFNITMWSVFFWLRIRTGGWIFGTLQ